MDLAKKRKANENGVEFSLPGTLCTALTAAPPIVGAFLSPEDVERILEPITREQLLPILRAAVLRHPDVLEAVRTVADADPVQRKLFVRGLGWETVTEKLRQVFSVYGELDEANTIVVTDKNTGKSKGYGFVTFKHIDAAILALKEPNKKIDGRMTVSQLAAVGSSANSQAPDVSSRKIYVGNIPFEISSERLLSHFSMYGEIQEGPLGFDNQTGKPKGFAFFVYKTEEGAKASLVDPLKNIDGHQLICKLATDNKKQKPNMVPPAGMMPGMPGHNYGGYMGYGPGPNLRPAPPQAGMIPPTATNYNAPMGAQGYFGGYGGSASMYDGVGGAGRSGFGGYRVPPSNISVPDTGNYGVPAPYSTQTNRPAPSGSNIPAYQGIPPY